MIRRLSRGVSALVGASVRYGSLLAFGLALVLVPLVLVGLVVWVLLYFSAVSLDSLWLW